MNLIGITLPDLAKECIATIKPRVGRLARMRDDMDDAKRPPGL